VRRGFFGLILLGFGVVIGAGVYWLGRHSPGMSSGSVTITANEAAATERKVLYYRDPMGKPCYSAEPKKDSMGMDYIPVYEGEDESAPPSSPPPAAASGGKGRILYYRNPMGLPDTSPVPKKDSSARLARAPRRKAASIRERARPRGPKQHRHPDPKGGRGLAARAPGSQIK